MFKRLPPHGKPDCATHLRKDETIDEAISRIATLEGLYKMYWVLFQKAQNVYQGADHNEMLTKKARAAVNKAMHLLAIELNLEKGMLDLTIANAIDKHRTRVTMKSEVRTEELQKSRNLPLSHRLKRGNPKKIWTGKAASQPTTVQGVPTRTG